MEADKHNKICGACQPYPAEWIQTHCFLSANQFQGNSVSNSFSGVRSRIQKKGGPLEALMSHPPKAQALANTPEPPGSLISCLMAATYLWYCWFLMTSFSGSPSSSSYWSMGSTVTGRGNLWRKNEVLWSALRIIQEWACSVGKPVCYAWTYEILLLALLKEIECSQGSEAKWKQ